MTSTRVVEAGVSAPWDAFVRAHPLGTFQHLSAWSSLMERHLGHAALPVVAERDGCVVGVLPLFHVRSRLFGDRLSSSPLLVYGGPLGADPDACAALVGRACREFARLGVPGMVMRNREEDALAFPADAGWHAGDAVQSTFRKAISADPEANLRAVPRKQRASVRRAMRLGLSSREGADVATLYRLFSISQRGHGTPVLPRGFVAGISAAFGPLAPVTVVERDGVPVAAALSFLFRDEVNPFYAGFAPGARDASAPDFLYWEVMRRAASGGARLFDFGRSRDGSGAAEFKRHWGFDAVPLAYRFLAADGRPPRTAAPSSPRYRRMTAAWRRLSLPVANLLGPIVVRGIG